MSQHDNNNSGKTTVGVFFGGRSTEHEISVISANQAIHALDADKYNIIPVYITKQGSMYTGTALTDVSQYRNIPALLEKCTEVYMRPVYGDHGLYPVKVKKSLFSGNSMANPIARLDVVIPVLHGANGEDGAFQGLMQTIGIPYAGCDVMASANGMDKISMKMILSSQGIPVVDYVWFTDRQWFQKRDQWIERIEKELGYPVIVKPSNLGSSVGIGRADNREALINKVQEASKYASRIIVEHLVEQMQEINCSVLGDADNCSPSVLEEPLKTGEILSYEDKYMGGTKGTKGMQASAKRIPAELPEEMTARIQHLATETFRVLGCSGVSRVDVIVDKADNSVYVNEINTIPGSLSFYLWEATGMTFAELMDYLVKLALKRNRDMSHKTLSFDQNIFALGGACGTKGVK